VLTAAAASATRRAWRPVSRTRSSGFMRAAASLERAAGAPLLERRHDGVRPTTAGHVVLRHAATVLDQIDAAARELAGLPAEAGTVRLGWFTSAGASLLPRALAALRRTHPGITVITREGSTPTLVRALRAGTVDLALLASAPPFRPPDAETPPLDLQVLAERGLCLAVPAARPPERRRPARSAMDRQPLLRRRDTDRGMARAGRATQDHPHRPGLADQTAPRRGRMRPDHGARLIRAHRAAGRADPGRARRVARTTAHHLGPPPAPAHRASRLPRRRPAYRSHRRAGTEVTHTSHAPAEPTIALRTRSPHQGLPPITPLRSASSVPAAKRTSRTPAATQIGYGSRR